MTRNFKVGQHITRKCSNNNQLTLQGQDLFLYFKYMQEAELHTHGNWSIVTHGMTICYIVPCIVYLDKCIFNLVTFFVDKLFQDIHC